MLKTRLMLGISWSKLALGYHSKSVSEGFVLLKSRVNRKNMEFLVSVVIPTNGDYLIATLLLPKHLSYDVNCTVFRNKGNSNESS